MADVRALLATLSPEEREALKTSLGPSRIWEPLPGPQTAALESPADELLFGGSAGGGKTDLLLGLAATEHQRSIIFRREYPTLKGVLDRSREIFNPHGRLTQSPHARWRFYDGRELEFGAMALDKDKENYQGRPHDLIGWDEITQFTPAQYRYVNAWNRSTRPGQRSRVIATTNPPPTAAGQWVLEYWAPWLNPKAPRPAAPGELRWYVTVDGEDVEQDDNTPVEISGLLVAPRSRTFIPSRLPDNPFLAESGYFSVLQALPEPLRSQLLYGDFAAGIQDDPWQVLPTAWVKAAQARWTPTPPEAQDHFGHAIPAPLDLVGVDVARGGSDKTVLSRRHRVWFAPLEKHPGSSTPNGPAVAALVARAVLGTQAASNVDVIGVGSSVYDQLIQSGHTAYPINFGAGCDRRDRSGRLSFVNVRAYAYWALREALDPERGDGLMLPPDPELLADLTAIRWSLRTRGIQIEDKDEIKERLGRSPDCGDAVVLAHLQLYAVPMGWMVG